MKHILYTLCALLIFFSCNRSSYYNDVLNHAEEVTQQFPDSALKILDSIASPDKLSEDLFNRYHLLKIQAKYKADEDITSDTIIFEVRDYYLSKDNIDYAALAAYYCGVVLMEQKKQVEAMAEFLDAKEYAYKTTDSNLKGLIHGKIGQIFMNEFSSEAKNHFLLAANYFHEAKNLNNEIIMYCDLGTIYLLKPDLLDSVLYYSNKSLELAQLNNDSTLAANAIILKGIGYFDLKEYNNALECFNEAKQYTMKNDNSGTKLYFNISDTFLRMNMIDSAVYYINKSLDIARKDTTSVDNLMLIYKILSEIEESRHDYKQALFYQREMTVNLAGVFDENKSLEIQELQKRYKYEQVQNENKELSLKQLRTQMAVLILLLLIILITAIYYRIIIRKNRLLTEANNEILSLTDSLDEISDSLKEQDNNQGAIKDHYSHNFSILKRAAQLEYSVQDSGNKQGKALIRKFNEVAYGQENIDWKILYKIINHLHDGIFDKIKEQYTDLDETEFRMCCLIYSKMSSNEMSVILQLSVNTIHTKTTQIRKKLGIERYGNIIDFFANDEGKSQEQNN